MGTKIENDGNFEAAKWVLEFNFQLGSIPMNYPFPLNIPTGPRSCERTQYILFPIKRGIDIQIGFKHLNQHAYIYISIYLYISNNPPLTKGDLNE